MKRQPVGLLEKRLISEQFKTIFWKTEKPMAQLPIKYVQCTCTRMRWVTHTKQTHAGI